MASVPPLEFAALDATLEGWKKEDEAFEAAERARRERAKAKVVGIRDAQRRSEIEDMFEELVEEGSRMRDPSLSIRRPKK